MRQNTWSHAWSLAWPLSCLLMATASAYLGLAGARGWLAPQLLIWHADFWPHLPWTLWTAPLVHFLPAQGLAGALLLAALGVLGAALGASGREVLALLLACPLAMLALLHWPQVGGYWGFPLLIHAAAAALSVRALLQPQLRWLGLLMAGGLIIKLRLERGWQLPVAFDSGWGTNVVLAAHLSGAVAGALMAAWLAALAALLRRRRKL